MICFGNVPAGSVLPIMFNTFAGATGASITMTGIAVTDIEVYKGVSMTQRSSDNGYTLLDTDGIDLDGVTGIQGFSIDLGDNSDAGFFAAGSFYTVVVASITVDSQTVNQVAATFRIVAAEGTAGVPVADATRWNNLATVALPAVPTVAGRSIDVAATGEVGLDFANVNFAVGAIPVLGIVDNGTLQSATGTTAVLRAAASFADSRLGGMTLQITGGTGVGQSRIITGYVDSTDTATVDTWTTTPDNTSTYVVWPTAPASATSLPSVNATQFAGQTITAAAGVTLPSSVASPTNITAGTITTVTSVTAVAAGGITASSLAADAIGASELAADAVTEIAAGVLAAATATPIAADIKKINSTTVNGNGGLTPWGP